MLVENFDKVKELMAELDRCKKKLEYWEDESLLISAYNPPHRFDQMETGVKDHELLDQFSAFVRSCQIFYEKRIKEIRKQIEFL